MQERSPGMLKAAAIGGGAMGLVAGLPLLGMLNCACCSLVIGAGFLASYLYSRDCIAAGAPFRAGQGAWVGLIAGLFYTLVTSVVGGVVQAVTGTSVEQAFEQIESMGGVDSAQLDQARQFIDSIGPAGLIMFGVGATLIVAAIFSTIGGAIGGAVFKQEPRMPVAPPPATNYPPPV